MSSLDLAVIGNCAIASLIDRNGRHVWFCFPRIDADPVFCALVDGEAPSHGFMDVVVRDAVATSQSYVSNTAVLETDITDRRGGKVRICDFAPRFPRYGRQFRPPLIVRRIEPISGRPRVTVRIRPVFDYGGSTPSVNVGSNHLRFVGPGATVRVTGDMS